MLFEAMIGVGVFLIIAYSQIQKNMGGMVDLKSSEARALQGLYTLGIVFMTAGIALFAASFKCPELAVAHHNDVILVLTSLLGVTILALSAVLVNKLDGTAKTWAIITLVVGILMLVLCGAMLTGKYSSTLSGLLPGGTRFGYCGL